MKNWLLAVSGLLLLAAGTALCSDGTRVADAAFAQLTAGANCTYGCADKEVWILTQGPDGPLGHKYWRPFAPEVKLGFAFANATARSTTPWEVTQTGKGLQLDVHEHGSYACPDDLIHPVEGDSAYGAILGSYTVADTACTP
ncbi:MAG: hypothetical protein R6V05_03030 [Candidatus Brocadiia bacterium]